MHNNSVSPQRLRSLLSYDEQTGFFHWRKTKARGASGAVAGTTRPDGYVIIKIDGIRYRAHRLAFLYVEGKWPHSEMDHIDGNPSNNSWLNLRQAEPFENQQNKTIRSDNKSGFSGVSISKSGKWQAHIKSKGRNIYLGLFASPEAGHAAYLAAKAELHTFSPQVRS